MQVFGARGMLYPLFPAYRMFAMLADGHVVTTSVAYCTLP